MWCKCIFFRWCKGVKRLWGSNVRLLCVRFIFTRDWRLLKVFRLIIWIWDCIIYSFWRCISFWKELGLMVDKWFLERFSLSSFMSGVRLGIFRRLYMVRFKYFKLDRFLKVFFEMYESFFNFFKFSRRKEGILLKV